MTGLARLVAASLALGTAVQAQPGAQADAERRAREQLAAGDTLAAFETARDALDRDVVTARLVEVRLTAERTGAGLRRYPLPVRRRRVVATARRLLDLEPGNALALETLAGDAVATALFSRDRGPRFQTGGAVTRAEANVRLRGSVFDIGQRAAVRPLLDRTAEGRTAAAEAIRFLEVLLPADPASAAPLLLSIGVAYRQWALVARVADRLHSTDPATAALYRSLSAWRTGWPDSANAALTDALPRLSPAEYTRLLDLTPLLAPADTAAYRADPDAVSEAFWTREDPRRITPASERRTEHVARVLEADALFGRALGDLFTRRPLRGAETDRGRIWVRYGPPDRETGFTQDDAAPTYSRDAVAAYAVWEYDRVGDGTRFVFDDPVRTGAYRTYSPPASAYAETSGRAAVDDYVALDRTLQTERPHAYTDTLVGVLPLATARFRALDGATEAVVAFPVVLGARAGLFASGETVEAPQGVATLRLDSATTVRGETLGESGFALAERALDPLTGAEFALSDVLVVGGSGEGVVRGGLLLVPVVADTLARAVPISVYAEVYGLTVRDGRTAGEAEARLVAVDTRSGLRRAADRLLGRTDRRGVAVAAEFQAAAPGRASGIAGEALSLALDASGLAPGAYRLVLKVTDRHAGRSAEAERTVVIE